MIEKVVSNIKCRAPLKTLQLPERQAKYPSKIKDLKKSVYIFSPILKLAQAHMEENQSKIILNEALVSG